MHVLFTRIGAMKFYLNIAFLLHYCSVQAFVYKVPSLQKARRFFSHFESHARKLTSSKEP